LSNVPRVTDEVGVVTSRKSVLEAPPPGLGLNTVTEAVLAVPMSEERMLAVNCELLTNLVVRALPFQFTTDLDTKPVPFTVSVNPAPPGATASGTRGWLISGMGFALGPGLGVGVALGVGVGLGAAVAVAIIPVTDLLNPAKASRRATEQRAKPIKSRELKKAARPADFLFIE
jgi:hypothetical protein